MYRSFALILFASLSFLAVSLAAQEPAFYKHSQAARFESNPGVFHYVMPCGEHTSDAVQPPLNALCWPVRAIHLHLVDGKLEQVGQPILGRLFISASKVYLVNADHQDTSSNFTAAASDVQLWYTSGDRDAVFGSGLDAYRFVFLNVCYTCKSSDPEPPPNTASLDLEYGLVQQSLRDFPAAFERIDNIASKMRIEVTPRNQPKEEPMVPGAAMGLYSSVNIKLADHCSEPAKTCVQNYARYQACKADSSTANCGLAPTCSAVCVITTEAFEAMHAPFCTSLGDSMALGPDWTPYFVEDAKRRAAETRVAASQTFSKSQKNIKMLKEDEPPPPLPPEDQCGPAEVFNTAFLAYAAPGPGSMQPTTIRLRDGSVRVPEGVMQSLILSQTQPVYPAIAVAAHVTGTVILHATIAKDGSVATLEAIDGPKVLWATSISAVKSWKFKPYMVAGAPVVVDTTVELTYVLQSETEPPIPPAPVKPN